MYPVLNSEEQALVDSVQEVLSGWLPFPTSASHTGALIKTMSELGWTVPLWPQPWGSGSYSPRQAWLLDWVLSVNGAPQLDPIVVDLVGPLLMQLADEAQQASWLAAIASGESRWAVHSSLLGGVAVDGVFDDACFEPAADRLAVSGAGMADRLILLGREGGVADIVTARLSADMIMSGAPMDPDQVSAPGLTFERLRTMRSETELLMLVESLCPPGGSGARSWTGRLRYQLETLRLQTDLFRATDLAEQEVALIGLEVLEHRAQIAHSGPLADAVALKSVELGLALARLAVEAHGYYALPAPDPRRQHNELPPAAMAGQDAVGELIRYVGGLEAMAVRDRIFGSELGDERGAR